MAKKVRSNVKPEEVKEVMETVEQKAKEKIVVKEEKEESKTFAKVKDVDILNIRREPNGEVISQIGKNIPMLVVSEKPINDDNGVDWYKVASPIGVIGYAMGKYLFVYEEGPVKEV